MSTYKRLHNLFNFLEGAVALLAFVGVIGISTVIVIGLNPKVEPIDKTPEVAGESTNIRSLDFINLYKRARHEVTIKNERLDRRASFNIVIKSINQGEEYVDLTKVINHNKSFLKLNMKNYVQGNIGEDLKIEVISDGGSQIIFENGESKEASFLLQNESEKNLQIKYSAKQNINFPFELRLEFSY